MSIDVIHDDDDNTLYTSYTTEVELTTTLYYVQ